ncbi:MAG: hypothetical protein ACR2OH_00900, partial [Microthrixaceae bacterium]
MRTSPAAATAVTLATAAVLFTGCGSSSQATAESGEREGSSGAADPAERDSGATDEPAPSSGDFCAQLAELSSAEVSIDDDPEAARAAAQQLRELGEVAPPEVADAVAVFADLVDTMAELDPEEESAGMDAFGEMMELMFSPELIEASLTLENYLVEECGMDPTQAEQIFGSGDIGGSGPDVSIPEGDDQFPDTGEGAPGSDDDPDGISLDDMEALEEANSSASWTQKPTSTGIANDQFITLSAAESGERAFTRTEALEACEAIRTEFES